MNYNEKRREKKERLRAEAEIRNQIWAAIPKEKKIEILKSRPGLSAKQLKKIKSEK